MAFIPDGISMLIIIMNVKWSVSLLVVLLYIICGTISRFFNEIVMQVKRTQQRGNRNRVFNETWTL